MLSQFNIAKFTFHLKAEDSIQLPSYKGSTFRGAFGHTFRKIVCALRKDSCDKCLLKETCIYSYVFETPIPKDSQKMKKYTHSPHPFILEPPFEGKRSYSPGDSIIFNLVLIGKSIDYLPYFIYTFIELGKKGIGKGKGKFLLEEVRDSQDSLIFFSHGNKFNNTFSRLYFNDMKSQDSCTKIKVSFLTPARIKYDGKRTSNLEFHVLIRNLLRRISILSYFHCKEELDLSFSNNIIEKAKNIKSASKDLRWLDWERYSSRQNTRMKMGGITGDIIYEGEFDSFSPFIKLGEYIHVGNGTSFGLGKYEMEILE